jgi:uncharacterized protein (DUF342 family)
MSEKKTIRITSESVDAAIRRAETTLRLRRDELEIKIVQEESKGLLGKKKAVVEFSFDPHEQELRAREYEISKCIDLRIVSKGIYLMVNPIPDELREGATYIIRKYLQHHNIFEVDRALLKKIIELQCGKYILIQKTDIQTIGKARLSVFTTSDMMCATLIRFDTEPVEKDQLLQYLEKRNIKFGIKEDILDNLGSKELLNKAVIIAEGVVPVTEIRAPLKYNFDPDIVSLKLDDKDNVDFKNISELTAVEKGQVLAEKSEPIEGLPGKKINGKEIPFDIERDNPIPHGRGVSISANGRSLRAEIGGHLVFDYGIISVEPVYVVEKNLDFHTGNIHFDGAVVVCGDVLPGFKITATGRVEVRGVIDGGTVETQGSLMVKQGIFSKDNSYIKAGGTVVAKHIEGMRIEANTVRVLSSIINAEIKADDYVEVLGEPGTIIGGTVEAGNFIKANTIGSPIGNKTCLTAGSLERLVGQIREITGEMRDRKTKLEELSRTTSLVEEPPDQSGKLAVDSDIAVKLAATQTHVQEELEKLAEKLAELRKEEKQRSLAKVHFRDDIYEGVTIRIFTGQMTIDKPAKHGSIVWEDDAVNIVHYHYREGV